MDRELFVATIRLLFNDLSTELSTPSRSSCGCGCASDALHKVSWEFMDLDVDGCVMRAECNMEEARLALEDRDEEAALARDCNV